jgi:hypothetical protein
MPTGSIDGLTFIPDEGVTPMELSGCLEKILAFLKEKESDIKLIRYDDWWEHDGLMFKNGQTSFEEMIKIVKNPELIESEMSGDDRVKIGICPEDERWYLRFLIDTNIEDTVKDAEFDLTIPFEWVEEFKDKVVPSLELEVITEPSLQYFSRIMA